MFDSNEALLDRPWRPAFELEAGLAWLAVAVYLLVSPVTGNINGVVLIAASISTILSLSSFYSVYKVWVKRLYLFQSHASFQSDDEYENMVKALPNHLFLGNGYKWKTLHRNYAEEFSMGDVDSYIPPRPFVSIYSKVSGLKFNAVGSDEIVKQKEKRIEDYKNISKSIGDKKKLAEAILELSLPTEVYRGWSWMHGLEESKVITMPLDDTKGNTLLSGTTRSGKSVMLKYLIRQLVMRKECTIIFDPKGDVGLMDIAMEAANDADLMDNFALLHLAFPSYGVRFDPMSNFDSPAQLASRIEPIIPSSGKGGDSFSQFAWGVMESIFSAMVFVNIKPSIMTLRSVLERGPGDLLFKAILHHCEIMNIENFKQGIQMYKNSGGMKAQADPTVSPELVAATDYYKEIVKPLHPNSAIDGLLTFFEHNREHASKMLASLMPVLKSLTTGELQKILSPDYNDASDPRPILDFKKIIKQKKVVYIGLNSMGDKNVADAVASLLMSDLTSVAASRYNFIKGVEGEETNPLGEHTINLLMDEMSNLMNSSCIELLNKGAGAHFRVIGATQTTKDLTVALGDNDEAMKALGNFNNLISLRVIDDETKKYISEQSGEAFVTTVQKSISSSSGGDGVASFGGGYGGRSTETATELVPGKLLKNLPDLEYFAFVSAGDCYKGRVPILVASENKPTIHDLPWNLHANRVAA